ncbi:hypothetical protein QYF61_023915 [Mycteria americana]|uniref:Uncharacterized protein n=1 Tax=Mycteria americana TaxID=33587 RepID=A0AAN7NMH0_MYCAM|nr:hypothetical protein QYF61_023915 [Mycteria americana]
MAVYLLLIVLFSFSTSLQMSGLQPFRETSPKLFDHSLAALGCGGYEAPFNYSGLGKKPWVAVKLNGTAGRVG